MAENIHPSGFNGQERDDELAGVGNFNTALYWEYDTRLGRRWNVDPKSVERDSLTPYNTFRLNPIINTDPWGDLDDDYSVDKSGHIELVKKTKDKSDKIYAKDVKGKIDFNKSLELDKGILVKNHSSQSSTFEPSNLFPTGGTITRDNYLTKNDSKSTALFEFLSENTNVEWSLTRYGSTSGENGLNILSTTHRDGDVSPLTGWLMSQNNPIRGEDHNHPGGDPTPSAADKNSAVQVLLKYPKAVFRIYTADDNKYTKYANYGENKKTKKTTSVGSIK
jgi:hypothetical protein